jgi:hypothetical protein
MNNISLNQLIECGNPEKKLRGVDCVYWNINTDTCQQHCSLKKINVVGLVCQVCKEKKPVKSTPAEQMRGIMEQTNYFNGSGDKVKIKEEFLEKQKSFAEKAKSYSGIEASQLLQGKVSEEVFNARKEQCLACHKRVNPLPDIEKIGWCGGCGCGSKNPRAGLSNKLYMPSWECPLKKFGKEKGEGFNIADATDSVKGVITSVKNLFSKEEENGEEKNKE